MPFALIIVGLVMLVSSARNTQSQLWTLLVNDFTGQHNFVYWFVSIMAIGSVGYIKPLRPIANAFLTLVIIVLFLSNKGFFSQFLSQVQTTNTQLPVTPASFNQPQAASSLLGVSPLSNTFPSFSAPQSFLLSSSSNPFSFGTNSNGGFGNAGSFSGSFGSPSSTFGNGFSTPNFSTIFI